MAVETLEGVQAKIRAAVPAARTGMVALRDARGLVLAAEIVAGEPVPPFANTAMDGYAVRAADTATAPVRLRVVADLAAGYEAAVDVGPGEAIRIMTGAPMPHGADAIVMVERTERDGDDGVLIQVAAVSGCAATAMGSAGIRRRKYILAFFGSFTSSTPSTRTSRVLG